MPRAPRFEKARPVGLALRLARQERAIFHAVARAHQTTATEYLRAVMAAEAVRLGLELPKVPAASPAA